MGSVLQSILVIMVRIAIASWISYILSRRLRLVQILRLALWLGCRSRLLIQGFLGCFLSPDDEGLECFPAASTLHIHKVGIELTSCDMQILQAEGK